MRVGSGGDVHAFAPGDFVMLGGVRIAHTHAVLAHSDGDVVLHALCDALLGAAALGDIGMHFPDSDPRWRGVASAQLLAAVVKLLGQHGFAPVNVDITVIAQAPRITAHRAAMRANLASLLGIAQDRINVKATTTEQLGFIGRAEGIAAQAIALVAELAGTRAGLAKPG
jgi:2-C-methyl-D-erythritol 2,4-cyclodiphosphate synthase